MTTTILADDAQRLVMLGQVRLEGWIEEPPCQSCGAPRIYWAAYDATFCPACNTWLELRCTEPSCHACGLRPATPLRVTPPGPVVRGAA